MTSRNESYSQSPQSTIKEINDTVSNFQFDGFISSPCISQINPVTGTYPSLQLNEYVPNATMNQKNSVMYDISTPPENEPYKTRVNRIVSYYTSLQKGISNSNGIQIMEQKSTCTIRPVTDTNFNFVNGSNAVEEVDTEYNDG